MNSTFSVRRRSQQIKAKYRARFQDRSHADVHDDDDDDDNDVDPGSDFEGSSEEGEEAALDNNDVAEADEKYGQGGWDDPMLNNAPDGMGAYQKASAWYYVSYSDTTNPFIAAARNAEKGRSQGISVLGGGGSGRGGRDEVGHGSNEPHMLFLSFPWICACQQLCQIKEMSLRHGPSEPS